MKSSFSVSFSNNQLDNINWLQATEEFLRRSLKEILFNRIKPNKIVKDTINNSKFESPKNQPSNSNFDVIYIFTPIFVSFTDKNQKLKLIKKFLYI